jgi:hypothetical protein
MCGYVRPAKLPQDLPVPISVTGRSRKEPRTAGVQAKSLQAAMTNSTRATSQWTGADDILNVLVHAPQVRLPVVLGLLSMMSALMPGVTLYGLTRDQDPELALPALTCRAACSERFPLSPQWPCSRSVRRRRIHNPPQPAHIQRIVTVPAARSFAAASDGIFQLPSKRPSATTWVSEPLKRM